MAETFIPSTTERALNDFHERCVPLNPLTLKGWPISRQAIALSCDCEMAVANEDALHVFLPQYPEPGGSDDELSSESDDADSGDEDEDEDEDGSTAENEATASSKKGSVHGKSPQLNKSRKGKKSHNGSHVYEDVILPDGTPLRVRHRTDGIRKVRNQQRNKSKSGPRKQVFYRRPYEDPDAPLIEWKEAHDFENFKGSEPQYLAAALRFPVLLPDARANFPLWRTMQEKHPLGNLSEWEGDVKRRQGQTEDVDDSDSHHSDDEHVGVLPRFKERTSNSLVSSGEGVERTTQHDEHSPDTQNVTGVDRAPAQETCIGEKSRQIIRDAGTISNRLIDPCLLGLQNHGDADRTEEAVSDVQVVDQLKFDKSGQTEPQLTQIDSVEATSDNMIGTNGKDAYASYAWGQVLSYNPEENKLDEDGAYDSDSSVNWVWPETYEHRAKQGSGVLTSMGSSLNHVVAIEWSPNTVGFNGGQVLAVLTGHGTVTIFGASPAKPRTEVASALRHDFSLWEVLWGVGGKLVIPGGFGPRDPCHPERFGGDYITAFSWSRAVGKGKALMAYMTDDDEVVVVQVQCVSYQKASKDLKGIDDAVHWIVLELGRFDASGPHTKLSVHDPDFLPNGTTLALKWSPWERLASGSMRCQLSHISNNYVGFREILITDVWEDGCLTDVTIGTCDTAGMCRHLSTESFLAFEDKVWKNDTTGISSVRGILATPFILHPFEVPLHSAKPLNVIPKHSIRVCNTVYPRSDHSSQNPITGLVIHPPDLVSSVGKPRVPYYTLTRLSATRTNTDWWETNLPSTKPSSDGLDAVKLTSNMPGWCEEVVQRSQMALPEYMQELIIAGGAVDDATENDDTQLVDGHGNQPEQGIGVGDGDNDDDDDEYDMGAASDEDDEDEADVEEEETPGTGQESSYPGQLIAIEDSEMQDEVTTRGDHGGAGNDTTGSINSIDDDSRLPNTRVNIHGLAISPAQGVSAIVLTQQWTKRLNMGSWFHARFRVVFSQRSHRGPMLEDQLLSDQNDNQIGSDNESVLDDDGDSYTGRPNRCRPTVLNHHRGDLTTEAQVFDWIYGGGPPPRGLVAVPDHEATTGWDNSMQLSGGSSRTQQEGNSHIRGGNCSGSTTETATEMENCSSAGSQPVCDPAREKRHLRLMEGPVRKIFRERVRGTPCRQCGGGFRHMGGWVVCAKGHAYDICVTSGMPMQVAAGPGPRRRMCGVCGGESLLKEYLVGLLPDAVEAIEAAMPDDDRCGACGGKLVT